MKKTRLVVAILLAMILVLTLGFAACNEEEIPEEKHVCKHICPTCGLCQDPTCTDPVCADKCQGHKQEEDTPVVNKPVITVVPETIEINAGDEIDLMLGVSVTGAENVIIEDDDDIDPDNPEKGEYTIVYSATNEGGKTTATRTIKVGEALSQIALEVRQNLLGEQKWPGTTISFKNSLYVEVTEDTVVSSRKSGIFHNTSDGEVVVSVAGGYGVAAILNANGVVIEGRDGLNGRLVNAENPVRTSIATGGKMTLADGTEVAIADNFAKEMKVPAGGFAVVVQNGYAGDTRDNDGTNFMEYSVIYNYGNVVRIFWVDDNNIITPYVDQAPVVSGNGTMYVAQNDATFALATGVVEGITATDDNGTFEISDDVKATVSVVDDGEFDVATVGEYTVTLSAEDAEGNKTSFTRLVVVTDDLYEMKINDKSFKCLPERIVVDQDLTVVGNYSLIIYTPAYEGTINYSNGYGEAIVVNKYGKIVKIFDGANAKYYDEEHTSGVQNGTCSAANYAKEALAARGEGDYVIVAPHTTANSATGGSRKFLLDNRTVGAAVVLPEITWEEKTYTVSIDDKSFTTSEEKFSLNQVLTAATTPKMDIIVYTKAFGGTTVFNGNGVAIVVNKFGVMVKYIDYYYNVYTAEGEQGTLTKTEDVLTDLAEGEVMIMFPNQGSNPADGARAFGVSLSNSFGKKIAITDMTFAIDEKVLEIDGTAIHSGEGGYLVNQEVTEDNRDGVKVIIIDKEHSDVGVALTEGGVAIVLDVYGKVVKIYDAVTLALIDSTGKVTEEIGFTAANYATVALAALQNGEMVVIIPGATENPAAALCVAGTVGLQASVTDVKFLVATKLVIGTDEMEIDPENIKVNEAGKTAAANTLYVYTTAFVGEGLANGNGEAFVVSGGKIVRIYDGVSGKQYDADHLGANGVVINAANYFALALASLQPNEILYVAPNDGVNTLRSWLASRRTIGADMHIEGVDIQASADTMVALGYGQAIFAGKAVVNAELAKPAENDFLVYTYGYSGIVSTNNYGEVYVLDANGKLVKVYDCFNGKYYDKDNTAGVARTDEMFTTANACIVAFEALQPGETMIVGINGGRDSGAARKFMATGIAGKYNNVMTFVGVSATASATEDEYATISRGGKTWYQTMDKVAIDGDEYTGIPAFRVYNHGFTGTPIDSIQYGVAIKINTTTNQIVALYDSANGRLHDAEHPAGASYSDNTIATIIEGLEENEILLVVQNGGTTGNALRAFVLGSYVAGTGGDRAPGTVLTVELPQAEVPAESETTETPAE